MRTNKSIRNVIWTILTFMINLFINFYCRKVFIDIMGNEYNGLNSFFVNISSMLSIAELGISNAIIFKLYKPFKENDEEKIKSLILFYKNAYMLVSFFVFTIGILLMPFLKYMIGDINININIYISYFLFIFDIVLSYLLTYKRSILIVSQNEYIIKKIHILYVLLYNIFQIVILKLLENYYLYLGIKLIFTFCENLLINIYVNHNFIYLKDKAIPLDEDTRDDILKKVKALFFHKVAGFIVNGTDNILISIFFGIVIVGKYSNYFIIISSLIAMVSSAFNALTPSIGNLLVDNNKNKNFNIYKKICFANYIISLVSSCILLFTMQTFMRIWLGNSFLLDNSLIYAMVFYYFYKTSKFSIVSFKDAAGIYYEDRFVPLIESIINILFSILFAKLFGLIGILIGTVISNLFLFIYSYPKYVYNKLFDSNIIIYYKDFIRESLLFFGCFFIIIVISNFLVIGNLFILLVIEIIIGILIPTIVILLVFKNDENFKYYFNLIICKTNFKGGKKNECC